jgi:predicted AAA+ superfamily ATPase
MNNNHTLVTKAFQALRQALAPYIVHELSYTLGAKWWQTGVLDRLYEEQKRDLPQQGDKGALEKSLDIQRCLLLFDLSWNEVFRKKLSIDHRTWGKELIGVRNRWAHLGGQDFSDDDTWRALDTMSRLCEQLDAEATENIRALLREFRYGAAEGSTSVAAQAPANNGGGAQNGGILSAVPQSGLPSWRDVIAPHPDVAQGRYKNAEFAADLAQVARGEGAYEYRDPVEFFARTYVTEGLSGLLGQALKRVGGRDGEPVIQLKPAFGGGKTHSMLALYHLMRGQTPLEKIPNLKPVLARAGLSARPRAKVAVLVGTALDPSKSKRPPHLPGVTVNTLWGEMASQLAAAAGNPKLYDLVKEADKKGVSPGSEALKNLFDACSPCLVLMDELVSYAKRIYGASGLPAGTFDNFISFIQEITEAARASKNSLVVASIPESEFEIGGEAGQVALGTIEHTFGRLESIWKPVAANEGFEVVRRRLFLDCKNQAGREQVCNAFSRMYADNIADFPLEARELEYKERLLSCYPIHPEVFDRLYEDWATLERFQRTRGVLRLMAAVIHELWMGNDAGLMIMPGSLPLDVPTVRDELTRHLSEGWNALVDREVDGKRSIPYQKDQANPRYGKKLAARRVARAIMLGSAPSDRAQTVRGVEASRVRLAVAQPGESIADFNDALNTLQTSLAYLYSNPSGDRFWYDTRPTLRKTVEDRATQVSASDVEHEIETRLRKLRKEAPFSGLHICPASSLDVPDEQSARLVILRITDEYKASTPSAKALTAAEDILNNRGTAPRIYRNMLAFIAPDLDEMNSLKQEVRRCLAWRSIKEDSEDLNLDAAQNRETDNNLKRSNETVDLRLKEAYCWLLAPYIDRNADMKTIQWDIIRLSGGSEGIITKAVKKMVQNESLITRWAPALLLMELDKLLWRDQDSLAIKTLWDYLCAYCYLPRLASYEVLEDSIRSGLNSSEYFALASGLGENRFIDLKGSPYVGLIERSGHLVKIEAARKQIAEERATKAQVAPPWSPASDGEGAPRGGTTAPGAEPSRPEEEGSPPVRNTHFYLSAHLDNTRINRDVQRLVEEVISHLTSVEGAQVEVSLEVTANVPAGLSPQTVRVVSENCRTLKVRDFGFDG